MTDREVFIECCRIVGGSGIREVHRLIKDAKELTENALTYDNGADPEPAPPVKRGPGRPPKQDKDPAPPAT